MNIKKKTQGTLAKELVFLFYERTGLKFTNHNIMVAIKNTKTLLNAGYTYDEIKDTIEYCVANPPENGIYSFGFIVHEINKVTTLLKNQNKKIAKQTAIDKESFNNYGLQEVSNKDKIKLKENKEGISIFK